MLGELLASFYAILTVILSFIYYLPFLFLYNTCVLFLGGDVVLLVLPWVMSPLLDCSFSSNINIVLVLLVVRAENVSKWKGYI